MNLQDLVQQVIDAVLRRTRFYGFYLYEVTKDEAGRMALKRVGDAGGHPDLPGKIVKVYGAHGITTDSTVGSQVLVGFEGGRHDRPFVAHYLTKNPVSITVDADSVVQIATTVPHGPGATTKHVYVGSHNRHPVARKDDGVYVGQLQFVPGAGLVQIVQIMHNGSTRPIGTIAGPSLVFTPDPGSFGIALLDGHISTGSDLFESE
ncbi:MAG: hypothetical protein U0441_14925 [Polyangiaceae bacterium]